MNQFFTEPEELYDTPEAPAIKNRKKRKASTMVSLLVALFLLAMIFSLVWPRVSSMFSTPEIADYTGAGQTELVVEIPEGATGADMAQILVKADVVKSAAAFIKAFNENPRSSSIMPGPYTLRTKMSAVNAIAALLDPANRAETGLTIPEGFTQAQIFARIEKVLGIPITELETLAQNPAALGVPVAVPNMEGWYSPRTYRFGPNVTAKEVLETLVAYRLEDLATLDISQDQWQRVITVASIVQHEVNWPEYFGQVARVIENRLQSDSESNGLLQMDSTVLYAVGKNGGIPTSEDLAVDSPYNTYKYPGLPPSPISNPGVEVLQAVVNAPAGDWQYFVTVNLDSGETKFASTLDEHNQYVAEFRRWYTENRG